jgi:hypothetical protein
MFLGHTIMEVSGRQLSGKILDRHMNAAIISMEVDDVNSEKPTKIKSDNPGRHR